MNNAKLVKKFRTLKVTNIIFYIVAVITTLFFEKSLFKAILPKSNIVGISFFGCAGIVILISLIYFANYYLINLMASNLLYKKCNPSGYKEVFFAITPRNNYLGKNVVELICEFMSGNFDLCKTKCYDYIKNSKNLTLIQYSVIVLCQIFFLEKNKIELEYLRTSIEPVLNHPKLGSIYTKIHKTASAFLEFLNGNHSIVLNYYKNAKEYDKNKCDMYISMFYYALALYEDKKVDESVTIFEEIMNKANGLFVVKLSKDKLMNFVLENKGI